jgi:hypothetical protein
VKINGSLPADRGLGLDISDRFRWNTSNYSMRWDISRDYRTCCNHCAFANPHAVGDDRAGSQPDVVFNYDSFGGDALFSKRPIRLLENVVDSNYLGER